MKALIWIAVSTKQQATEDKDSLQTQETNARSYCESMQWDVVDILRVDGHSRHYLDFHQLATDARKRNIPAFDQLYQYIQQSSFDVLIVRDGDRFARTQALHAYITESIINSGAFIYSLADGKIDRHNHRMWIAMAGYRTASEIDSLVKKRKFGIQKRAERGLPTGNRPVKSHRIVRDQFGKGQYLEVNPEHRHEIECAVKLMLDGCSFKQIQKAVFETYGYGKNNKPYSSQYYRRLLTNPVFWGHTGIGYADKFGMWRIEDGHPIPADITMFYNTHEPALTEPLSSQFRSILKTLLGRQGKRQHAYKQRRYAGLILCANCGHYKTYNIRRTKTKGDYRYLSCKSGHCKNQRSLLETTVDTFMNERLTQLLQSGNIDVLNSTQAIQPDLETIAGSIEHLQTQMENLITQRMDFVPDSPASKTYTQKILTLSEQIDRLNQQYNQYQHDLEIRRQHYIGSQSVIKELQTITLDTFWSFSDQKQNRLLHRLMGDNRLVSLDNAIVGITLKPPTSLKYI